MTYRISRTFNFEAAHFLPNVPVTHKCHNMHGHSYRVDVEVSCKNLDARGFVMDFAEIDDAMADLIKLVDHKVLNEVGSNPVVSCGVLLRNPTAENIARWFWECLGTVMPNGFGPAASKLSVRVWENGKCWAEYRE